MPHTFAGLARIGPKRVLVRAFARVGIAILNWLEKRRALKVPTYQIGLKIDAGEFPRFFHQPAPGSIPPAELNTLRKVCEKHLNHEFDLLCSGWIRIRYGMTAKGLGGVSFPPVEPDRPPVEMVNEANREEAVRVLGLIDNPAYQPIDWHIAYRSGYRWRTDAWCKDCRKGLPEGVDIKEPWELCRMQHLVVMAAVAGTDEARRDEIAAEIRNEILDFIAHNPLGFGVNWACTMDVAMRACSWLIAHDLCRDAGIALDAAFGEALGRSIHEHASFIATHLEWSDLTVGNHYLLDLVGLIFCCAYLPSNDTTQEWLSFGIREFEHQVPRQFNPDGSQIECSTAYHCFVAETVAYTVSLLAALARQRGSEPEVRKESWRDALLKRFGVAASARRASTAPRGITAEALSGPLLEKISRMAAFIDSTIRPDGGMLLIGDNDSGWFVKLGACCADLNATAATGPVLEHAARNHIAALIRDLVTCESSAWLSGMLPAKFQDVMPTTSTEPEMVAVPVPLDFGRHSVRIPLPPNCGQETLVVREYPDFGLILLRRGEIMVSVRTKPDPRQLTGHRHDDSYSVTVAIGRDHPIDDPGIPCYTPFPKTAARYRGKEAHFAPQVPADDCTGHLRTERYPDGIRIASGPNALITIHWQNDSLRIASDYPLPALDEHNRFPCPAPARAYGMCLEMPGN